MLTSTASGLASLLRMRSVFLCGQEKYLLDERTVHFCCKNAEVNTFIFMWDGSETPNSLLRSLIEYNGKWVDDSIFDFFRGSYEASGRKILLLLYGEVCIQLRNYVRTSRCTSGKTLSFV